MPNLLELLWCKRKFIVFWKIEATDFEAHIKNSNNFKSFKHKDKLLGDTYWHGTNGILRNTIFGDQLKCYWLIAKLKLKLTNCCVLALNGTENNNACSDNNIFAINDTKPYVLVGTLPDKSSKKSTKIF